MSCTQLTAYQLTVIPKNRYPTQHVSRAYVNFSSRAHINFSKLSLAVVPRATKLQQHGPVCLFGGKGKSGNTDEGSPWKALEKAMGNFKKKPSIEEQLKQQIAKKEFYKDVGGGGGGGGSGGGGDGSFDESEDESMSGIVDEVLQVILATFGFVFLYIFIIDGEDITRLAKDFIKFIFSGKKSIRLGRVFYGWSMFLLQFTTKPEVEENWLEYEIINTPTLYDGPNKYRRILKSHLGSRSNDFDDVLGLRSNVNDDDMGSRSDDNDDDMGSRSDNDDDDQ